MHLANGHRQKARESFDLSLSFNQDNTEEYHWAFLFHQQVIENTDWSKWIEENQRD